MQFLSFCAFQFNCNGETRLLLTSALLLSRHGSLNVQHAAKITVSARSH